MFSNLLIHLYSIDKKNLRRLIINLVKRFEKGEFYSTSLRKIFAKYHKVYIGLYTHGGCFQIDYYDPNTEIGRYCSIAKGSRAINVNHPLDFKSTHAFFFNPALEFCESYLGEFEPLKIGNDVWVGHNAIIMPNVSSIGDGAVIAAGAVVNKDIPPYAVMVGNPARVVRFRFSQDIIRQLLQERWWENPVENLKIKKKEYLRAYRQARSAIDSE